MLKLLQSSRLGATPGKLALIAVLAGVLVVVVAVQFGGGSSVRQTCRPEEHKTPAATAPAHTARGDVQPSTRAQAEQNASHQWPRSELNEVLSYDPFAAPSDFFDHPNSASSTGQHKLEDGPSAQRQRLARKRAEQDQFLAQLQKSGVKAVVAAAGGRAALVGAETVRLGDVLGGFRVIAIEADGVVLERLSDE